jgi:hypothetical protein
MTLEPEQEAEQEAVTALELALADKSSVTATRADQGPEPDRARRLARSGCFLGVLLLRRQLPQTRMRSGMPRWAPSLIGWRFLLSRVSSLVLQH